MVNASTRKPEDYVIASGQMKSVREFIELSAIELGWNKEKGGKGIIWEKSGLDEIGRRKIQTKCCKNRSSVISDQLRLSNYLGMHQKLEKT